MFFLWEIELLASLLSSLHLCILWSFCKEHEHAHIHTHAQNTSISIWKERKKRQERGREEGRMGGRDGGLGDWGKLVHWSPKCHLACQLPFILLSTRMSCPFIYEASLSLPLVILHTSLWDCSFLVADKTQVLRIKTSLKPQSQPWVQPEAEEPSPVGSLSQQHKVLWDSFLFHM